MLASAHNTCHYVYAREPKETMSVKYTNDIVFDCYGKCSGVQVLFNTVLIEASTKQLFAY